MEMVAKQGAQLELLIDRVRNEFKNTIEQFHEKWKKDKENEKETLRLASWNKIFCIKTILFVGLAYLMFCLVRC